MKLRFFFDAGAGICIWSGDDCARDTLGYAIELRKLPLSEGQIADGESLIRRFDASMDWNNPGGPALWSEAERQEFLRDANKFHSLLVEKLGPSFEILNEART